MVASGGQVDTLDGVLGAVRDGLHRAVVADESAAHLAPDRPGRHQPPRDGRRRAAAGPSRSPPSTTSTTASGCGITVPHPTPSTRRSCAACTTWCSVTRTGTGSAPHSAPASGWVSPPGCCSTSRGGSSGGCRRGWARWCSPRSTRRSPPAASSSASSTGSTSSAPTRRGLGGRDRLRTTGGALAGPGGYDPLVHVGGLPCWPDEPDRISWRKLRGSISGPISPLRRHRQVGVAGRRGLRGGRARRPAGDDPACLSGGWWPATSGGRRWSATSARSPPSPSSCGSTPTNPGSAGTVRPG